MTSVCFLAYSKAYQRSEQNFERVMYHEYLQFYLRILLFPLSIPTPFSKMDSFEWHKAETAARRAVATRFIYDNPGTDLIEAMRVLKRIETSNSLSQSGLEAEESTFINNAQSKGVTEKSSGVTPAADIGKSYPDPPLRTNLQNKLTQNVYTEAASEASQHGFPSLEQRVPEGHLTSTGHSVKEKDLDEKEEGTSASVSEPPKAGPIGDSPSCENCQKKRVKCSLARPRCRRCKKDKKKCIYPQEPGGQLGGDFAKLPPGHACSECGRKGLKCGGELPECNNCKDREVECLYQGRGMRKLAKNEQLVLF